MSGGEMTEADWWRKSFRASRKTMTVAGRQRVEWDGDRKWKGRTLQVARGLVGRKGGERGVVTKNTHTLLH